MGSVVGEKLTLLIEYALQKKIPLVIVSTSGGARMQESILSLMQMAKTSAALGRLHDANIPYISILTNPTTGGVTASFASLGDIIIAEPNALICFAGPRVIEQTIGHQLPEGAQKSEFLKKHGMVDCIVKRHELKAKLSEILSFFTVPESPYGDKEASSSPNLKKIHLKTNKSIIPMRTTMSHETINIPTVADENAHLPHYASSESSGADVKAFIKKDIIIPPGARALIPTGLRLAIPHGYEIQVRPRSGLALKHGITVLNTPGTIDADYRGELGVILINLGQEPFTVQPGMRIAQLIVAPIVQAVFALVEKMNLSQPLEEMEDSAIQECNNKISL